MVEGKPDGKYIAYFKYCMRQELDFVTQINRLRFEIPIRAVLFYVIHAYEGVVKANVYMQILMLD